MGKAQSLHAVLIESRGFYTSDKQHLQYRFEHTEICNFTNKQTELQIPPSSGNQHLIIRLPSAFYKVLTK